MLHGGFLVPAASLTPLEQGRNGGGGGPYAPDSFSRRAAASSGVASKRSFVPTPASPPVLALGGSHESPAQFQSVLLGHDNPS